VPIYDYVCSACHRLTEVVHGIAAEGPHFCPECGAEGTMTKVFSAPSVHFKGSGWAKKDRGSSARASARSKEGAGATDGGSDSTTSTDRAGSSEGDSKTADTKSAPPKKGDSSGTSSSSSGSGSGPSSGAGSRSESSSGAGSTSAD
jgi:putative FmdB family regulatory protein